jgi:hypothetical protein
VRLLHYSAKPLHSVYNAEQEGARHAIVGWKPTGLWVSADDEWKQWCEAEGFALESLKHVHEIILTEYAELMYIDTSEKLLEFHHKYTKKNPYDDDVIDWNVVTEEFDGILIAPYQWKHRLNGPASKWYYPWDVASGCIWNANVIESFYEVEHVREDDRS